MKTYELFTVTMKDDGGYIIDFNSKLSEITNIQELSDHLESQAKNLTPFIQAIVNYIFDRR